MKRLLIIFLFVMIGFFSMAQPTQKSIIYFSFSESSISPASAKTLDSIIRSDKGLLVDSINIHAYCDSVGNNGANDLLSVKRAESVKNYLLQKKLTNASLIKTAGFGKRNALNDNSTEELRAMNRRAVILIYLKPVRENKKAVASFADTIKTGGKFTLHNLNFIGGRHLLMPEAFHVLDTLTTILKQHPTMKIEIQGYVCCITEGHDGTDFDNGDPKLSVARAKTVYDYLIIKGIDSTRLSYKGFGSKPIVPENSEEARAINRRVEIKVLKK